MEAPTLPPEVLGSALRWLPAASRLRSSSVCRYFRDAAYDSLSSDAELHLASVGNLLTDDALVLACELAGRNGNKLKSLTVSSGRLTDASIRSALGLHGESLQLLNLSGCLGVPDEETAKEIAARCPVLENLDLSGCGRLGPAVTLPGTTRSLLPALETADFQKFTLTDELLTTTLASISSILRSLRLSGCLAVTDVAAASIASRAPKLRELDVGCARNGAAGGGGRFHRRITDATLAAIAAPGGCGAALTSLGLRGCHVTAAGLAGLPLAAPLLERLDLAGVADVGTAALAALASGLCLKDLNVSCCAAVTDAGVREVARLSPSLETLSLHGTHVTDAAVRWLCRHCRRLSSLNLALTAVSGRAIRSLASAEALQSVNMRCVGGDFGEDCRVSQLRRVLAERCAGPNATGLLALERAATAGNDASSVTGHVKGEGDSRDGCCSSGKKDDNGAAATLAVKGGKHNNSNNTSSSFAVPVIRGQDRRATDFGVRAPMASGAVGPLGSGSGGGGSGGGNSVDAEALAARAAAQARVAQLHGEAVRFDWTKVPREEGVRALAAWRGFAGVSGDVVASVLRELHPFTDIYFVPRGLRGRRDAGWGGGGGGQRGGGAGLPGLAWVTLEVDEDGLVVAPTRTFPPLFPS